MVKQAHHVVRTGVPGSPVPRGHTEGPRQMEPRLWVCITARKPWAWGLHLSVASLPLSPGETTLCPRPISTKTSSRPSPGRERTSKACRPHGPPSLWFWTTLKISTRVCLSAHLSDSLGRQRPGPNPAGLLPSGLRAAGGASATGGGCSQLCVDPTEAGCSTARPPSARTHDCVQTSC